MRNRNNSRSARLPLAITLIVASFASAIFIATSTNRGADFWIVKAPVITGHTISSLDVGLIHLNLGSSSKLYLGKDFAPIGMIATRSIRIGEIISTADLTSASDAISTSAVPLSVRSVDIAKGLDIGEGVDIYWVQDSRNGEAIIDPILILGGVTLLTLESSGNGFSSEVGLTIAVEETQVLRVLSATTQGRLVVIRAHV